MGTSEAVTPMFPQLAERIHERHLLNAAAWRLQQQGAAEDRRADLRAGHGDVDAVQREEERDVAWQFLAAGDRHRHQADWRLLALEPVDGPDADGGRQFGRLASVSC